jgi:hypothetical protein
VAVRATRLLAVGTIAVACLAVAVAFHGRSAESGVGVTLRLAAKSGPPASGGASGTAGSFTVAGDVEGLYPSDVATTTLSVTVSNPNAFAVVVSKLAVAVADASPQCRGSNVVAATPAGSFAVAARAAVVRAVPVRLATSAPDACQGASFPLIYTATAVKQ